MELGEYAKCGALVAAQVSSKVARGKHEGAGRRQGAAGTVACVEEVGWEEVGWDRERVLWVPAHRREEREFVVEVLPSNVLTLLRSAAAFDGRAGGAARNSAALTRDGLQRLVLFNDSIVIVREVRGAEDGLAAHGHSHASTHETQASGLAESAAAKGAAKTGGHFSQHGEQEQRQARGEVRGRVVAVRRRVGAWLRCRGEAEAHRLELQSELHRWWITELAVADVARCVSANVWAQSAVEWAVVLQHDGCRSATSVRARARAREPAAGSSAGDDDAVFNGGVGVWQRARPPVWVRFANGGERDAFLEAVARLKAKADEEMDPD